MPPACWTRTHTTLSSAGWAVGIGATALLGFFTVLIFGGCGPRELRLELDSRRYHCRFWAPMLGSSPNSGFAVPFRLRCLTGLMDDDLAGVGLQETRNNGASYYILKLVWRDRDRPDQVLRGFTEAAEARGAMQAAARTLRLPALGRLEQRR